ncbi:hypothetical protein GE09DRAFT_1074450 [Coniochaeta sp. 2T2.1]|nr:hypothetical protein GE09DRAFT_1074450 [Coniochaeta sp. 2T2.1]
MSLVGLKEGLDVYHAWIVEDLDRDVVRILTQQSQTGGRLRSWRGRSLIGRLMGIRIGWSDLLGDEGWVTENLTEMIS